jgi:hypothetical protein
MAEKIGTGSFPPFHSVKRTGPTSPQPGKEQKPLKRAQERQEEEMRNRIWMMRRTTTLISCYPVSLALALEPKANWKARLRIDVFLEQPLYDPFRHTAKTDAESFRETRPGVRLPQGGPTGTSPSFGSNGSSFGREGPENG